MTTIDHADIYGGHACQRLFGKRLRANIIGLVLNQVGRNTSSEGYAYYGYYRYGHYAYTNREKPEA